jgi:branched-chain amino acid transport system substrate-binding protein
MTRIWWAALALAAVVLAGCNPTDQNQSGNGNGTPPSSPGKTPSTPNTPPATANAGPVKLGFCFEESGDDASFGQSSRKGAEMAIDELNKAGGLFGKPIESVFEDNASKPDQSATAASKLVNEEKVNAVIGCVASSDSIAMAKIVEAAKVPMVSPASTKVSLTLNDDGSVRKYIFRTCFTDDFQGEAMVDFAVNGPLHAKNAVVFYASDNDYAKGIYQTVKDTAPKKGLKLVAEDSFLSSSETDFRTKLAKFKGLDFDVLIVPGYYKEASEIANQARELGLKQPLLGGDGFDSPDLWKNAGKNIEGSYFTNHYAADDQDPAVQGFIAKYKARYGGNTPDAMAILAYDCVNVVADAFKRAGSTDPDAVTAALAATKDFHGAAGDITIDDHHNAKKKLVVMEIGPGGALKWVYTYNPGQASGGSAAAPDAGKPGMAGGASPPPAGGAAPGGDAAPGGK